MRLIRPLLLSSFLFFIALFVRAAPDVERLPASSGAPLDLFSSQAADLLVPQVEDFQDRLILAAIGNGVEIIDTETWDLFEDQPVTFDNSIGGLTLLPNGTSLVVTLSNGDLGRIELDNIAQENQDIEDAGDDADDLRVTVLSDQTEGGTLGGIVADPDFGSEVVYFINPDDSLLFSFDFGSDTLTSITLDSPPNDIVFVDSGTAQKVFVCTNDGLVFVLVAGETTVSTLTVPALDAGLTDAPDLSSIAVTPDGAFVYVVDSTNSAVWVIDTSDNSFVDQQSGNSTDPVRIESDENTGLDDIFLVDVIDPDELWAYVSGDDGLTIIDASFPATTPATPKIVDQDESTADILDPLVLSGIPGPIAASTTDDGYVYTSNGDATVSVITDNPFLTIDPDTDITLSGTETTFSLTFQSDEEGTYRVVLNSDITGGTGTELIGDTALGAGEVDVDVTTATIDTNDFDSSVFDEGDNRVFIFLEDAAGNTGRDAVDISIDRPPPTVTVTDTTFGNEKAFVTFDKLSEGDIKTYHIVAKEAEDQASPECPGTLDFTADPKIEGTANHDSCSDSCEGSVDGLENGVAYCLAVRAEDDGGQFGPFGFADEAVFPEETVGPAGLLGETGCSLNAGARGEGLGFRVLIILSFALLIWMRFSRMKIPTLFWAVIFILGWVFPVNAVEDAYVPAPSTSSSPSPDIGTSEHQNINTSSTTVPINSSAGVEAAPQQTVTPVETVPTTETTTVSENLPEESKWFTFELKGVFWMPTNSVVEDFFGTCCNIGFDAEFGLLYKSQFNATVAVGMMQQDAQAVGINSGLPSSDNVGLLMIPIRNNFIYRFDYSEEQIVVPFAGAGLDYVIFHESIDGKEDSIDGVKFGVHGLGGVGILLDRIEDIGDSLADAGIDDVYFTLEGRYSKIDSFDSTGLDLSGWSLYFGFLMAF